LLLACEGKRETSSIRVLKIALSGNIWQSPSTAADACTGAGAATPGEAATEEGADAGAAEEGADAGAAAGGAGEGKAVDETAPPLPALPPPHPAKPSKLTKAAPERHSAKPRLVLFSTIRTSLFNKGTHCEEGSAVYTRHSLQGFGPLRNERALKLWN